MSKQRIIKDEIWDDEWFYDLDPSEKLIWIFLLTNPRSNIAGVYKINTRWIANLTGFDKDVVKTILGRFVSDGKIVYEDDWIALVNFYKHLVYKNPSVAQGIKRIGEEMTGCPQPVYSVYLTILNLTILNLADKEDKSSNKNKKNMAWKTYNENQHTDDVPSIDADSGEVIKDKNVEQNKKVTEIIEWAETVRGQKFLDKPTQRKMIITLKNAGVPPTEIRSIYKTLLESEYWKAQNRLPDFKTVFSSIKNKKNE